MRNTDSSGKTLLTTPLSALALSRSWPNGFSIDHPAPAAVLRVGPARTSDSCSHTSGNAFGGIDR